MAQSGQTLLFRFVAAVGDGGLQFGELFNELGGLGGHCVGLLVVVARLFVFGALMVREY